jgi:hypothetical protein
LNQEVVRGPNLISNGAEMKIKKDNGPNGIRTRVTDVRGQCPRPLDDGTLRIKIPITKFQIPVKFKSPNTQTAETYVPEFYSGSLELGNYMVLGV